MTDKILVAFATTHGSMQEVATEVAQVLRSQGFDVDLQSAREVKSLNGYSGVVLGGPQYMFHWHKDALGFLRRFQKSLTVLPVAIFAGGRHGEPKDEDWQVIRDSLDKDLANYPWFAPILVEIVGGRHDPDHLRFPWNLIPAMKQMPASDLRDWDAIRAWAGRVGETFRQKTAV